MTIINAPSSFAYAWSIIRSWLDKKTRAKVKIFGPDADAWKARRRCRLGRA